MSKLSRRTLYWQQYAQRLRLARTVLEISEKQAADAHGVTVGTYRRWENGGVQRSSHFGICGKGYGLSPRLARNHGGKCNPPGNGADQSQSTAISLKRVRGRQSLAPRLPVRR